MPKRGVVRTLASLENLARRLKKSSRKGAIDIVTKLLLAGILIALVGLLVVAVMSKDGHWIGHGHSSKAHSGSVVSSGEENDSQPLVRSGERVARPAEVSPPPPMVGRPERIQDVLQEGKTYEVITTADIHGPVREKEWGFQRTVHLAYRAEMQMRRAIEKNDGHRVIELRTIVNARMIKATSTVEVRFVPSEPGVLVLGFLDLLLTGGRIVALASQLVAPICSGMESAIQQRINDQNMRVKAMLDSLSGKTVRITYEDGKGVVELQPVDCTLSKEERDFLFASAVVTDAFLLPKEDSKPGDVWEVDGSAFTDLLPPSWRGRPRGKISIKRGDDFEENGKKFARLTCYYGTIEINATDQSRARLGSLTPRGDLKYNIADGHIESADLKAEGSMEEASRDHLLFETRFETSPEVRLTYFCHIINPR
jgi:hypothetical protein